MRSLFLPCVLALAAGATSQGTAVTPAIASNLPGNAAIAMPVRWTAGRMQVLIEQGLLPASLQGQTIRQIRLRRPAFPGEPAYPALVRNLKVSAAFTTTTAVQMVGTLATNRPASLAVVAGPVAVTIPATAANGHGDALGAWFVTIALAQPLAVVPGNLFLEFETLDGPFGASLEHWVDAFWTLNGIDSGLAAPVGNGGCTTQSAPLALRWTAAAPPRAGVTANFELTGAPGQTLAWAAIGFAPQSRPAGGSFFGYGASLEGLGMTGCYQWTPVDGAISGTTTAAGSWPFSLPLPLSVVVPGLRLGVQVLVLDPAVNPAGIATSNGLVLVADSIGIGAACTTVLAQGTVATSAWAPYRGLMPVLLFDF